MSRDNDEHVGGGGTHLVDSNLLGQSVVPDLMKVYESLTQSSTPHDGISSRSTPPHVQEGHQHHQHSSYYDQGSDQQGSGADAAGYNQHPEQQKNYDAAFEPSPLGIGGKEFNYAIEYQRQEEIANQVPSLPPPLPPEIAPEPGGAAPTRSSTRKRARATPPSIDVGDSAGAGRRGGRSSTRGSKGRKKSSKTDNRWSKRFQWPDELHREFVSAVFDVGLKHSSPSAIMENMPSRDETITSERVKSHLQKYRVHRARSKKEFMGSYDAAAAKFRKCPEGHLVDKREIAALTSGEVAAHLSCVASATDDATAANGSSPPELPSSSHEAAAAAASGDVLHLPKLTEEEKRSPIGASMGYLMGLFFALQQQLSQQRASQAKREGVAIAAEATSSPVSAPLSNPAGPNYGSYDAPPDQGSSSSDQTPPPSHQSLQHRYSSSHAQHAVATSSSAILEANNMMKRDMRAQMKLQNQMREFKNKEVAKVQHHPLPDRDVKADSNQPHVHFTQHPSRLGAAGGADVPEAAAGETSNSEGHQDDAAAASAAADSAAGAIAVQSPTLKGRGSSFSDPEFWEASLDDSELFEFLMS